MYRETRPAEFNADSWADLFGNVRKRPFWRLWRIRRTFEWKLIVRYIPRGGRILDAGCGNGSWVEALSSRYDSEGCDYSARMIGQLQEEFPHRRWRQADIRALPYDDGSFDGIISWGVIEHHPDGPAVALQEFHRVLVKGGVIIVNVPRDYEPQRRAAELKGSDGQGVFYEFCMTREELADFVKNAGFEVLEADVTPAGDPYMACPAFTERQHGLRRGLLTTLFGWIGLFTKRYSGTVYCVARKA